MVCSLVSKYFDSPQLGIQKNNLYKTLYYLSRDMLIFDFLQKGLGSMSPPHFVYDFLRKMFLMLYSDQFHYLIFFTPWDIGQYVHYNCLLIRLWRHKF